MISTTEAQAVITAAQIYLKRYKAANSALKEAKAILQEYMDDTHADQVEGLQAGSGARLITRSGDRQLLMDNMEDELIIWCARQGILSGSIAEFDKLPDGTRQTLDPYIGIGSGTTYVDIFSPPWGVARQQEKETARAERPTPEPLPAPVPIRSPHGNGTAPPVATPSRNGSAAPNPAPRQQATQEDLKCPDHQMAKHSDRNGGLYCPGKMNDGAWCKWTTASALAAQ